MSDYIAKSEQVPIVDTWLQREGIASDVIYLNDKGGLEYFMNGLKSDVEKGIDEASVEARTELYGDNHKEPDAIKGIALLFWEALHDLTLIALIIAAVLSIVVSMAFEPKHRSTGWIEGVAIMFAVFISAYVQAYVDHQKEKEFQSLNSEAEKGKVITCLRNGVSKTIPLGDIVTGDVIQINSGMEIPGDGVIIEGFNIECDEAAMTGEPDARVKMSIRDCYTKYQEIKSDGRENMTDTHEIASPILVSGTKVSNGTGKMQVCMVGKDSAMGKIRDSIDGSMDDGTPLQTKQNKIAEDIGKFGLSAAILTLFILVTRALIDFGTNKKWTNNETTGITDGLQVSITVLVVAIPEGLPLAVTLSLAFSVKRMMKDKNQVRRLHACETMGGANIICSDKTGTLTKNEMYLTHFWNRTEIDLYDATTKNYTTPYSDWINKSAHAIFEENVCVNSQADPKKGEKGEGQATELAICKYLLNCGKYCVEIKKHHKIIHIETFTSDRKRMSTIIEREDGSHRLYIKGASEYIVESCDKTLDLDSGNVNNLSSDFRKETDSAIVGFAKKSLRTIGLAYVDLKPGSYDLADKDDKKIMSIEKSGQTLIGICGIKDVIRSEVPKAVKDCHKAGIKVKMVTGDNKVTARAIAKEVNILDENDDNDDSKVMEGPAFLKLVGGVVCRNCKFDKTKSYKDCDCVKNAKERAKAGNQNKKIRVDTILNDEAFDKIWDNLCVLARSRPEDKYALVVGLKERNNVVAVTGDGTNDAPALSKADVGFAMGIAGTEVAKQAAAIMLMDDDFSNIVKAVKWGRNIYDSIRKFLQFQLTVNLVAVFTTFFSAAVCKEAILAAIQMLWVNLIMDTLASLALATEPPHEKLLNRKPHKRNSYIVSCKMTKHILGQFVWQSIILITFLFLGPRFLPEEISDDQRNPSNENYVVDGLMIHGYDDLADGASRHFTYNFNVFVMMCIFNFLNARKIEDEMNIFEGLSEANLFIILVTLIFVLQVIILTVTGPVFKVASWGLGIQGWLICIGFGATTWIVALLLKCIPEEKCCQRKEPVQDETELANQEKKSVNRMNSLSVRRFGEKSKHGSGNLSGNNSNQFRGSANNLP